MPITLRDQIIGEFSLSAPPESVQWNRDDLLLAEAVIAQVALAIENARLLEETQSSLAATNRLARRERMIADVSQELTAGLELKRAANCRRRIAARHQQSSRCGALDDTDRRGNRMNVASLLFIFAFIITVIVLLAILIVTLVITYRASTRAAQTISQLKNRTFR